MSTTLLPHAVGRWSRRALLGAVLGVVMAPQMADAASALVRWRPSSTAGVASYAVYVRGAGVVYGTNPQWTGNPTPAADGTMSAVVTYTPGASGTNYFSVVARSATVESGISSELPVGIPNLCRNDTCSAKTSCNFANRPDGTACDDDVFCNGPEICVAGNCDASQSRNCADAVACTADACSEELGQCTHLGPPGCCIACDSSDPCLADACAQGDCSAPSGGEIEVNRIKIMKKSHNVKLVLKARFTLDPNLDPSATGVRLQMRTPDGAIVYSSSIAGPLIHAGSSGGRWRYTASRVASDSQSNGITRLDFRVKGSTWLTTIMADTETLLDAAEQPMLTLSLHFGDSCFRHMDMPCTQKPTVSVCRPQS